MTNKGIWALLAIAVLITAIISVDSAFAKKDDLPNGQPFQLLQQQLEETTFQVDSFFDVFFGEATSPDSFFDIFVDPGTGEAPDSFFDIFVDLHETDEQFQTEIVALQLSSHEPLTVNDIQGFGFVVGPHTIDTNAGTLCAPGEYLDGDGTCKPVPTGGADNDSDPTNELQTLSISGTTLSISDGNSVSLPPGPPGPPGSSEPFIGEIRMFAGNFAPRGWALCDGQLLPISQHTALFSILGTTYGGDGRTTFALPDFRGRVAVHPGTGPGLDLVRLGEKGGTEDINIGIGELPAHRHSLQASTAAADSADPTGNALALAATEVYGPVDTLVEMNADSVGNTGSGNPIDNHQPYVGINCIIALEGVFPSRN